MTTIEEAAEAQLELWERLERGRLTPQESRTLRYASLKEGYEMRRVPEHGIGLYPVNVETGEVCEGKARWVLDGKVLLCTVCYLDGT